MWWISELLVECWIRSGGETCKLNRVSRHGKGENARFFIDIWKMCFLKLCQKLFPFTHSAHTYMDIEMIRDECYDICVQNLLTHRCNSFVPCHLIVHSTSVSLQQVPRCLCVRASVCVCIFKGKSIRFQVFDLFLQLRKKYCLIWSFFLWKQIICLFFYRINRVLVIQNGCFSS